MSDFYSNTYNPDVLSCLANLSNDEVFTPPEVVNAMLDMLPQELFQDTNTTFLDPACKSGVFLREIAKRLLVGLEKEMPDLQERIDHIFQKQLFGIAITEMTSLLSRRSVYCSKYPNGLYSISRFDNPEGNIRYKNTEHTWKANKCVFCGTSKSEYDRGDNLETHAYEFIHHSDIEELLTMRFDVIIGNPPYQLSDGGNKASAKPIYNLFVEQAKKLMPRYLVMVIPARWYAGGKGLDSFRESMLTDERITHLVDYSDSKECFPGVDIAGGICYFLWERDAQASECNVTTIRNSAKSTSKRTLNEFETFIRDEQALSIIHKIQKSHEPTMDTQVSSRKPFGLATNDMPLESGDIVLRHLNGEGPYQRKLIKTGRELIDKWKVTASYVSFDHAGRADKDGMRKVLSVMSILPPGTICTETYLVYGAYNSEKDALNLKKYLSQKLPRFLIAQLTSGQHVTKQKFSLCPIPDVTTEWTDELLYERYGLTAEEVSFIESTIREL